MFIPIGRMPFQSPTLDNAESLFALVINPVFYLHRVEMADQDPASDSLKAVGGEVNLLLTNYLYADI